MGVSGGPGQGSMPLREQRDIYGWVLMKHVVMIEMTTMKDGGGWMRGYITVPGVTCIRAPLGNLGDGFFLFRVGFLCLV